ncbi:D-2-hydroxyacid dehydrogenase family protein [Streptomyces sp. NPDC021093]|uniref:D-2-hydroxyacid dehydrogenase family protein n=1 Tax=Streptomyces sp. NPDC021093 TaxID=3365112 RepID=UPI003790F0B6
MDDYQQAAAGLRCWQGLPEHTEVTFFHDHLTDASTLVERLRPFDAVVAMRERTPFPAAVLERLPALRLLITTGMSNAAIDLDAARLLGITVCGTRLRPHPAAELTWALILELAKRTGRQDTGLRAGAWQSGVGLDLDGATLGVVGLGKLGRKVAAIGAAFGMDVVAWSQNLTAEHGASAGVEVVSKEELFRRSDYVTIHLRYSERTRSVVGEAELGLMKPTAFLVNTSRAPIVDQAALLAALHGGRIGGAGLDVHPVEPVPASDPVLRAPHTVLTPHIGYVTRGNFELSYSDAAECVSAFLSDRPVRVL